MALLIILGIATTLSIIFSIGIVIAVHSVYPEMKLGDIIDAFSTDKPKTVEEKHKRIDIIV